MADEKEPSAWDRVVRLLGSAQKAVEDGIKTDVEVTFPGSVYFNMFALVIFCAAGVVLVNYAARRLQNR